MSRSLSERPKLAVRTPLLERPFYFIVVLWGKRFREYFLDYCLASLLSPGNIPSLSTRQPSKFLIATSSEDWQIIKTTAIFKLMERYVVPVFLELPPCPAEKSGCLHASVGHKMACELAYANKAYMMVMSPDEMFSEGTIRRAQELVRDGVQLILGGSIRFGEEPFLDYLRSRGAIPRESCGESGKPLVISSREMVLAALHGFHTETSSYEWGAVYLGHGFTPIIPAAWWNVPGEDGIVLHTLSWLPFMLDYAAVGNHDTSTFDDWTIDGDYIHENIANLNRVHIIQDSDEMFTISWAPLSDKPFPFRQNRLLSGPYLRGIFGWQFARSYYGGVFNATKQQLVFKPLRWHARPLNAKWNAVEKRAERNLLTFLMPADRRIRFHIRFRRWLNYPLLYVWRRAFWIRFELLALKQTLRAASAAFVHKFAR